MICSSKLSLCALLSLCTGSFLFSQKTQITGISSENLIQELINPTYGEPTLPTDSETLDIIYQEVCAGNAYAKKLWGDYLMESSTDSKQKKEARSLYKEAAKQGVPSAELAYAKALQETEENKADKVYEHLLNASALGSAEADRLLAELLLKNPTTEKKQEAWMFLNRAADRKDLQASLEVADAYLSGTWQGMELTSDQKVAKKYCMIAVHQQSPQGALQLSILLSQDKEQISEENYQESIEYLYYAYLWANKAGNTQLIEQINQLGETNSIYPRTYLKARYLYEQTIVPEVNTAETITGTLEAKIREGSLLIQKVEGTTEKATLTLLGFPYDQSYIWDGTVQITEGGQLIVPEDDTYWHSATKQPFSGMPYFVKILDGTDAGLILDVASGWKPTQNNQITLAEPIELIGTAKIAIGQWRSFFSIFGEYNTIGLKPGTRAKKADQVLLLDSVDQQVQSYFFNNELMAWVSIEEPDVAITDFPIPPWQALFVLRRQEAPLYISTNGTFSNTLAYLPVDPGVNLITNVEGRVLKEDESDLENTYTVLRADELPIYSLNTSEKKFEKSKKSKWWKLLGISSDTPVYMKSNSAFIFAEDEQTVPYILQR